MVADPHDPAPILTQVRAHGRERIALRASACAIYARVSRVQQDSIPVQLEACRRYAAERLCLPIAQEFQDKRSGLDATREGYQSLLALARSGRISHVVVFRADRFGREDGEYVSAMRELERLGVELHGADLGKVEPDMVGLHAWLANKEVRATSARVLPSQIHRAKQGRAMHRPPFGYRRTLQPGIFEPDENAPLVVELFRRYRDGESVGSLARWLSARTGVQKRETRIANMLNNAYYCGVVVYNRQRYSKIDGRYAKPRSEWVYGRHDAPLIDIDTWNAVQGRLALNKNVGRQLSKGPRYPLTGLVWCATCRLPSGKPVRMHGQSEQSKSAYTFYTCPCCKKSTGNRKVETALRRLLDAIPIGIDAIQAAMVADAAATTGGTQSKARELAEGIEKLKERRRRLTILYAEGELTSTAYHDAIQSTDADLQALYAEQDTLEQTQAADKDVTATIVWLQGLSAWTDLLDDATVVQRNEVYRQCVSACSIDKPGRQIMVRWTPAVARLTGTVEQTCSLVAGGNLK